MLKHFPVEFPLGMSVGTDRSDADETGRDLTTGEAHKRRQNHEVSPVEKN